MAPPPAVVMLMPAMIANLRRLYESGAVVVAGTDAGIAPVKPHDVIRHAPPMLRQLGFSPAEGCALSLQSRRACADLDTVRAASRPASTPTSSPSTVTRSPIRKRCTASGPSTLAAPP